MREIEPNTNDMEWAPTAGKGVHRKMLRKDPETGAFATLLKFETEAARANGDMLLFAGKIACLLSAALAWLVERVLEGGAMPPALAAKVREIVVHVDSEVLETGGAGRCEIANGPGLAAETVRRLACDAAVVSMVDGAGGELVSVGRRTRGIPPAMRRARPRLPLVLPRFNEQFRLDRGRGCPLHGGKSRHAWRCPDQ